MANRKILLTEEQFNLINGKYPVEPKKVLVVKNYLDKSFNTGNMGYISNEGTWQNKPIVAMLDNNGNPVRNMTDVQLFYHIQDRFKDIYANKNKRDRFLKTVMIDWYNKDISKEGILKHNIY